MYAYISHLDPQCRSCLILLTGSCDQEQSNKLNECRKTIQQKLTNLNIISLKRSSPNKNNNSKSPSPSPTSQSDNNETVTSPDNNNSKLLSALKDDKSLHIDQIGITELRHFLYKENKTFQYYTPKQSSSPFLNTAEERKRIFNTYQNLYHRLHNKTNGLRIIYTQRKYETYLGWLTRFDIFFLISLNEKIDKLIE
jgi:hypothetical protein